MSELIPQPHGGALRNGGTNRGGPGRPASEIRAAARDGFEVTLSKISKLVAEKEDIALTELCRAADVQGKYGMGEAKVIVPDEVIEAVARVLAADERIPAECIDDVTRALAEQLKG